MKKYMKTKELVMGISFGAFLFLALSIVLFTLPNMVSAHEGEMHSTVEEAKAHLLEKARVTSGRASTTVNTTCMATAVETRESSLMTAWNELMTTITTALTERKTALVAAWGMSSASDRNRALTTAWKEWRADKKAAHAEFRKDRKAAWDAFKKTAKDTCKISVPKDEALEKTASDTITI
jgi:hypothetical protein